jgi:hypothetical protein
MAISAILATAFAAALYVPRLGGPVTSGTWLGPMLAVPSGESLPTMSRLLVLSIRDWAGGDAVVWLHLASLVFGALSAGLVAVLTTDVTRRHLGPLAAAMGGVLAGAVFAVLPAVANASTAAAPTTLSVFLILATMLATQRAINYTGSRGLFWAAILAGLAAANHPPFAVVSVLLLVVALAEWRTDQGLLRVIAMAVAGFYLAASLPLTLALARGDTLGEFIGAASNTPYPAVGGAAPHLGFAIELRSQLHPALTVLALAGAVTLLMGVTRRSAAPWALILLFMGPLLPVFTNPIDPGAGPVDLAASTVLFLAAVAVFVGWGATQITRLLLSPIRLQRLAVVPLAAAILLAAQAQWDRLPDRSVTHPEDLGGFILESCPENAVLITGTPGLTSLINATQALMGTRLDVAIVPYGHLVDIAMRRRLRLDTGLAVESGPFPPQDAADRWRVEIPIEMHRLAGAGNLRDPDSLRALALWDLVRDNFQQRSIVSVGVDAPWLTARAETRGAVLQFPRGNRSGVLDSGPWWETWETANLAQADPPFAQAVIDTMLPLSAAARQQVAHGLAATLATAAATVAPGNAQSHLHLAQTAARAGDQEEAVRQARIYLELQPRHEGVDNVSELIRAELDTAEAEMALWNGLFGEDAGQTKIDEFTEEVDRLWLANEFTALSKMYVALAHRDREEIGDLYEAAALFSQLGDLERARIYLTRAVDNNADSVRANLTRDTRFLFLLLSFDSFELTDQSG